jgi:hypothetical protein
MLRAPETELTTIRQDTTHFRPADPLPDPLTTTPDGHPILAWDVFLAGDAMTLCYSPVVQFRAAEIHASNRFWCFCCANWIRDCDSVSHYRKHLQSHEQENEQIRELSGPSSFSFALLSFILKRGEPLVALDFLRNLPFGQWLATCQHFIRIVKILKECGEADIRAECARSEMINPAVDGWSDACGGRYHGVTARLVDQNTLSAWPRFLAMKEIKCVHEWSGELRVMLERLQGKYDIQSNVLNLCTDRASINESAFRQQSADLSSAFGESLLRLPSACHLLNNALSSFLDKIRHRLKTDFPLSATFAEVRAFSLVLAAAQI